MSEAPASRREVEALYRDQGQKLWRAIRSYAGDSSVADEAVAEAFAQLLRRGDGVRDPAAWIWTTAFRVAASELSTRSRWHPSLMLGTYELPDPLPELLAALGDLPRMQRAVILLHDYADRPTSEIAQTFGIARSTVRVHLSQARRTLRKDLEAISE